TFRRLIAVDGTWQLQHLGSGRFVGLEHHTGALLLRTALPSSGARFAARPGTDASESFAQAVDGAETVVLVVGNDPHVHGRETEDRPHVRLSGPDRASVRPRGSGGPGGSRGVVLPCRGGRGRGPRRAAERQAGLLRAPGPDLAGLEPAALRAGLRRHRHVLDVPLWAGLELPLRTRP